jgi:hypothetical protein
MDITRGTWAGLLIGTLLCGTCGAEQIVYPAKGQTPDQQRKDEAACSQWATQKTGFDPAKPAPATASGSATKTTPSGSTAGAGVGGAARGAIVGGMMGDAGAGAAAGAVAARGTSRRQNAREDQSAQQQAASAQSQQRATFDKARAACLEGRGYSVK